MKVKSFTLISGNESRHYWSIRVKVKGSGTFIGKGDIRMLGEKDLLERQQSHKIYYQENRERILKQHRDHYKEEPDLRREIDERWRKKHPEISREVQRKNQAKRKRELGYEPINEWFEGADGHHVTKDVVIYIPAALHRSMKHNIFTGEGMEEINKLAFEFLETQEKMKEKRKIGKPRNLIIWEKQDGENVKN